MSSEIRNLILYLSTLFLSPLPLLLASSGLVPMAYGVPTAGLLLAAGSLSTLVMGLRDRPLRYWRVKMLAAAGTTLVFGILLFGVGLVRLYAAI